MQDPQMQRALMQMSTSNVPIAPLTSNGQTTHVPIANFLHALIRQAQAALQQLDALIPPQVQEALAENFGEDFAGEDLGEILLEEVRVNGGSKNLNPESTPIKTSYQTTNIENDEETSFEVLDSSIFKNAIIDLYFLRYFLKKRNIKIIGTKEDIDLLGSSIKNLKRKSPTFKAIYSDLSHSENMHILAITEGVSQTIMVETFATKENGRIDLDGIKKSLGESEKSTTLILLNPNEKAAYKGNLLTIIAHEFGHAWRFDNKQNEPNPPAPNYSSPEFDYDTYRRNSWLFISRDKRTEELEASHIENMCV